MAAGYAPIFRDRPLTVPALEKARTAIDLLLKAHEPNPALTVDRDWTMVAANASVASLLIGVDPNLLKPPVNVMQVSLHPRRLAPLIVNLAEWRAHLIDRLRRQQGVTRDPAIGALLKELAGYHTGSRRQVDHQAISPALAYVVRASTRRQASPACPRST